MGGRTRTVVWTPTARDCLDEILGHVAPHSRQGAERLLNDISAEVASLSTLSERGVHVPEVQVPNTRQVFVHPYRIIYRISSEEVQVLAVLHEAMDFARRMQEPDG